MSKVGVVFVVKTKIKTDKVRSDWLRTQAMTKYCTSVRYRAYLILPDGLKKEHIFWRNMLKLEYTQESSRLLLKEIKELIKATRTISDVPVYSEHGEQISTLKGWTDGK